ncbi:MAG: DUF4430 domain-containing protein [Eubacteriales bacterium]|nr:DUF4430 domain-containing protein [Eubacteriales bacterium]
MSKNKTRLLIAICLAAVALAVFLLIHGLSTENKSQDEPENPITVSLTITYPEDSKYANAIKSTVSDISVEDGSTVSDALQLYCSISNIPLSLDKKNGRIIGIEKIKNDDKDTFRVWRFKLNGELVDRSAKDTVLSDGDKIEFSYDIDEDAARKAGKDPAEIQKQISEAAAANKSSEDTDSADSKESTDSSSESSSSSSDTSNSSGSSN